MSIVVGVIALALIVVVLVQIGRAAWRLLHDNEEMVMGGSWGNQFFGRRKHRDRRPSRNG